MNTTKHTGGNHHDPHMSQRTRWARIFWPEDLVRDLRRGVRSLYSSPGLVVVSALSLGLGIGLNAILYMAISTIYWHEPTMRAPSRVVGVDLGNANQLSYPDYQDLVRSGIFESAFGFRTAGLNLGSKGRTVRIPGLVVTANFFEDLGVSARLGRVFSTVDADSAREPRVVVVTSGFWRTYLGSDPAAVGKSIVLTGEPFDVVGVLPDDYRAVTGWQGPSLYVPVSRLTLSTIASRESPSLSVLARLGPNTTVSQAQQAVEAFSTSLESAYPDRLKKRGRSASLFPIAGIQFRGAPAQLELVVTVAWVTAGFVMLIACVNVTALMLARATYQARGLAIRVALGAGRARLIQATLSESFLLVASGAAIGIPLAFALNQIPLPASMAPLHAAMQLDRRILPYAATLVGLATLLCGVIPALRAMRTDVIVEIRRGGGAVTPAMRLRLALLTAQIAMSFVLMVSTLLCVRSQSQLARADVGFDIDHGVVARFALDSKQYAGAARVRFAERLVERVAQVNGVSSVGVADLVPLGGDALLRSFHPAGRTDIPGTRPDTFSVGPGYFRTLAIPIRKGRDFEAADREGARTVAIVNETFAATYFANQEVIGQRVQTAGEPDAEVIGVAHNSRIDTIGEAPRSVIYYAYAQRPSALVLHVRSEIAPSAVAAAVRKAIDDVDTTVPVKVETLRDAVGLELTMRRMAILLMGTMGGVGVLLAAVGLYGVMSYVAASRTVEIGIRMTLGASPGRIRQEMLWRALIAAAPGVAIGGAASLAMVPWLKTFLAGVSPFDPVAFTGAAMLLIVIGLAAGYRPAHKSAGLDPVKALRCP